MARSITLEDAMKKAVQSFYEGIGFESYEKATKEPMKYSLDMFDELQSSLKKGKKKKNLKSKKAEEDILEDSEEDMLDD